MLQENVSIKSFNTFGIDVETRFYFSFNTVDILREMLQHEKLQNSPKLVLGGGSNMLFTKNYPGVMMKNNVLGKRVVSEDEETVLLEIGAGENWHETVLWVLSEGFSGIENMSLIPGEVGAAPIQNIGAYGMEIKDVFESLTAYELATGDIKIFKHKDCEFGYRDSIFKRWAKGKYVILKVVLRLNKKENINVSYGAISTQLEDDGIKKITAKDVSNAIIKIRESKLPNPKEIGNAGSFFKNPVVSTSVFESVQVNYPKCPAYPAGEGKVKMAAGWLIEQAGWKGKDCGNYGVHKNQALVLVNYGGAKGNDVFQLSEDILQSVKAKFGVELEREVNIL